MVVQSKKIELNDLDTGQLALFVGLRVNELVTGKMRSIGFRKVRESHGYLIQHLIESERSITELARRMSISQQAVSKAVAELVRLGVLEESAGKDRRSKRIGLSGKGWKSVRAAQGARMGINRRLQKALGDRDLARMKKSLIKCLGELGGIEQIRGRRVRQPD